MTDERPEIEPEKDDIEPEMGADEEAQRKASEEFLKREVPEASFLSIVGMYQGLAYQMLGAMSDPDARTKIHPSHAKYYIDCLAILDEKTRDKLDEEERKALDTILAELRLAFVKVSGKGSTDS